MCGPRHEIWYRQCCHVTRERNSCFTPGPRCSSPPSALIDQKGKCPRCQAEGLEDLGNPNPHVARYRNRFGLCYQTAELKSKLFVERLEEWSELEGKLGEIAKLYAEACATYESEDMVIKLLDPQEISHSFVVFEQLQEYRRAEEWDDFISRCGIDQNEIDGVFLSLVSNIVRIPFSEVENYPIDEIKSIIDLRLQWYRDLPTDDWPLMTMRLGEDYEKAMTDIRIDLLRLRRTLVDRLRERGPRFHESLCKILTPLTGREMAALSNNEFDRKCAICASEYPQFRQGQDDDEPQPDNAVRLSCGHVYGEYCVSRWLLEQPLPNCPSCRRPYVTQILGYEVDGDGNPVEIMPDLLAEEQQRLQNLPTIDCVQTRLTFHLDISQAQSSDGPVIRVGIRTSPNEIIQPGDNIFAVTVRVRENALPENISSEFSNRLVNSLYEEINRFINDYDAILITIQTLSPVIRGSQARRRSEIVGDIQANLSGLAMRLRAQYEDIGVDFRTWWPRPARRRLDW